MPLVYNKSVVEEMKDLIPISDDNVLKVIMQHLEVCDIEGKTPEQIHDEFLSYMPEDLERPSFNQWIYHYNVINLQILADYNRKQSEVLKKKAKQLRFAENIAEAIKTEKKASQLEQQYHIYARDLIKYSNDGINRETPKKVEIAHSRVIDLKDFHKLVRQAKSKIIDVP